MAKKLRLRGASRYSILTIRREPFERGDTVSVDDTLAERLLKERVSDRANNKWPIWEEMASEDGSAKVEEGVKKTTRRRRRAAKAPASTAE